ncbi:MAG: hypothetical protein Q6365_015360 [Candidatus Sigynarchaeota archaeon]
MLGEIKTYEQRQDISWLLRNYKDLDISEGEKRNIEQYLSIQFDLVKNGYPTDKGMHALKNNWVHSPHYGVCRLYYIENEPIIGSLVVIGFELVEATKEFEAYQTLENYKELEGSWKSWFKSALGAQFSVEFEHEPSVNPVIIEEDPIPATITIHSVPDGTTTWLVESSGSLYFHEETYNHFDLSGNMCHLLADWDAKKKCLLVDFASVSTQETKVTFTTKKMMEGCSLIINGDIDDGNYSVSLVDIPIRPRTLEDAKNWLLNLLFDKLHSQKRYYSSKSIKHFQEEILKNTPLKELHPTLGIQALNACMTFFENAGDEEIVQEIVVADDLG